MTDTHEIPGPKGGIFGLKNLMDFQKGPIDFLMHTVHDFPEDIVHWKFGPQYDMYLVVHPDYIHELLVKKCRPGRGTALPRRRTRRSD